MSSDYEKSVTNSLRDRAPRVRAGRRGLAFQQPRCHQLHNRRVRRVALVTILDVKQQPLASLVEGLRKLG